MAVSMLVIFGPLRNDWIPSVAAGSEKIHSRGYRTTMVTERIYR